MFFFFIFLALVLCSMGYVLWHVWCILPFPKVAKWLATIVMAACLLSMFFFLGGALDKMPLGLASISYEVSTSAIIVLLYLFLLFIVADVARLIRILPAKLLHESWTGTLVILAIMLVLFIGGNIHYRNKVRVPLQLTTTKHLGKSYKMVMVSDLHIGYHNRRAELSRWVDLMNAEHPDLVLIAGDIIDNSVRPLVEENMAEEFKRIEAPIYACLGNHEYFSKQPLARKFYQDAGIHLLIDEQAVVDSVITIIGRDDRTNQQRSELDPLARQAADGTYTIVLNHQPYELEKTAQNHIDFQFSGHTHRGQIWPISWITDHVYECSHGLWQQGATKVYVSSGLGIWGGKFRIGTQSEYVVATLEEEH